jgi:beta-lactamase superfamily II metal-dependent hydrolase
MRESCDPGMSLDMATPRWMVKTVLTKTLRRVLITALLVLLLASTAWGQAPQLVVHFIDVGQADAILIQCPSGQNILIDAGNNADGDLVVSYLKQHGVRRLDHLIGTHPHEDHIGGLDNVIRAFAIGKVYMPRASSTTSTYEDVLLAIKAKGLKITESKAGVKFDAGVGVTATFLAPHTAGYQDLNDYSAVLRLSFGQTTFLFAGDAEAISEREMLQAGDLLKADVLKVGHHGSDSSTTSAFLKAVTAKYAVISVGKGNIYGLPTRETLSRLNLAGVQVLRTDTLGAIVVHSDGKTVTIEKSAHPGNERAPTMAPAVSTTSTSQVVITGIDREGEIVAISNAGTRPVDLSGWRLVSVAGDQMYYFPPGTQLAARGKIQVVSGPNAAPGLLKLVWKRTDIWNNTGDPGVLYDSTGKRVSQYGQ